MSAEELSKLSLGENMVTTRAGAKRARNASQQQSTTPSPAPSQSPSAPQSPTESASPTPSLIESAHGLKFNVSTFDTDLRRRAKRGLMDDNVIKMKYCRLLDHEPNQYMFYLDDEIQVAMGGPHDTPRCTCGANEKGTACKHIFWMLDHLTSGAPAKFKTQALQITEDGSSVQGMKPAHIVDRMTLQGVAEGLEWPIHEGPVPEDDEIVDEIAEMLSVFEPSEALPAEFKGPENQYMSERSRKYREFKQLFTDLFTQYPNKNLGLLDRLQTVIDADFQAQVFFEKVNYRIARAFSALDEYIQHGPKAAASERSDVPKCAEKLREIVQAIDEYFQQQKNSGYDTEEIASQATISLIKILHEVAKRNLNAYADISWNAFPPQEPEQNNLFVCLIGTGSNDTGFVLSTLQTLPVEAMHRELGELSQELFEIGQELSPQWTPQPFIDAFHGLTTESRKRAASDAGGSTSKRTMQ